MSNLRRREMGLHQSLMAVAQKTRLPCPECGQPLLYAARSEEGVARAPEVDAHLLFCNACKWTATPDAQVIELLATGFLIDHGDDDDLPPLVWHKAS